MIEKYGGQYIGPGRSTVLDGSWGKSVEVYFGKR